MPRPMSGTASHGTTGAFWIVILIRGLRLESVGKLKLLRRPEKKPVPMTKAKPR